MIKKLMFILCTCLLIATSSLAETMQPVDFVWTLTLGGNTLDVNPVRMVPARTGGLYVVGSVKGEDAVWGDALGETDGFVLSINAEGQLLWIKRLGGSGEDLFTHVIEAADGSIIAMGTTLSLDGDARSARGGMDAWMVRIRSNGELLWSKCLGGALDDSLQVLMETDDGDLFACGRTQSRNGDLRANNGGFDAWAILLREEDGKPRWTYRYGDAGDDQFIAAAPIESGWLVIGEKGEEQGLEMDETPRYASQPVALRLSKDGKSNLEEVAMLGDVGDNRLLKIEETKTGWILAGESSSRSPLMPTPRGGKDIWMLQMRNGSYHVSSLTVFGGKKDERLMQLAREPGGDYIFLCTTESQDNYVKGAHGSADVWVVCVTPSGLLKWEQALGGSSLSSPAGLLFRYDGSILVAGTSLSQDGDIGKHNGMSTGFLAQLSTNGNLLLMQQVLPEVASVLVDIHSLQGRAYLLGKTALNENDSSPTALWVARLAPNGYLSR